MVLFRRTLAVVSAVALSGCAGTSLDRMAEGIQARSTCHTSTGEHVPSPGCVISYSATVSSTTTTTTTTTTPPTTTPANDD